MFLPKRALSFKHDILYLNGGKNQEGKQKKEEVGDLFLFSYSFTITEMPLGMKQRLCLPIARAMASASSSEGA